MPLDFLDSSVVVQRSHTEAGSEAVNHLLTEPTSRYFISRLTVVEVQRPFVGKVRAKQVSVDELGELRHRFVDDVAQRRFIVIRLTDALYNEAERLVQRYGPADGDHLLRTLDALQIACALETQRRKGLTHFVSADKRQCEAAAQEEFTIINPTL